MGLKNKLFSRKNEELALFAYMDGTVISLSGVEDEVFSKKILGDGLAIIPSGKEIYSPIDAVIDTVFDTHHAISMTSSEGIEILIHCGIDTVKLGGEGFEPCVKAGDKVSRGELILKFDPNVIKDNGYSITTPIVILNSDRFLLKSVSMGDRHVGEKIAIIEEKKA